MVNGLTGGVAEGLSWSTRLRGLLNHPLTRDLDLDNPRTTELRRQIILSKPFLRRIYDDWYQQVLEHVPDGAAPALELGSGAGFLADLLPNLITSEVIFCQNVRLVANATALPFRPASLRAIVMTDVLHHIPDVRLFFRQAAICVVRGGAIVMVEPWTSAWSRIIWKKLHHEPFRPESREWSFPSSGPLSGANGALPWIIFDRDRELFAKDYPQFKLEVVRPMMPFRYLVSGGVSTRNLMPGFTYQLWTVLERLLQPWMRHWAMFALIVLRRS
jgi:Methyltransferase domain